MRRNLSNFDSNRTRHFTHVTKTMKKALGMSEGSLMSLRQSVWMEIK